LVRVVHAADALEASCARLPLLHPFRGELAGLDVVQDALHLSLGLCGDDARTRDVLAPLSSVRDRVVHVGDAALVDEVDDELHFVQAFEVRHFRSVASLDQRLETSADELDQTAAQNDLLTEQIGLALFLEGGLDDARTTTADAACVRQREVKRVARSVLGHSDQARHAAALLVLATNGVTGALRRDHDDVNRRLPLDETEMNVEAVRESNCSAVADVASDLVAVDVSLQLVRSSHHDQVSPGSGLGDGHDLKAIGLDLLCGCRTSAQCNCEVLRTGLFQVQRVGAALRAVADNSNLLALDQIEIGIAIIINTHVTGPSFR